MKGFRKLALALALAMIILVIPKIDAQAADYDVVHEGVPIYRLYSPTTLEHLYTADVNEKDTLYKTGAWGYEGVAWYAPDNGLGKPVYRLYNKNQHNHLYTMSQDEINMLLNLENTGWSLDNGGKPVFYSGGQNYIYRLYNESLSGMHHLTTDENEYNVLPTIGNGWTQEGKHMRCLELGAPIPETLYYGQNGPENLPVYTCVPSMSTTMPTGSTTIDNCGAVWAIQADVNLNVTGTGAHAKLCLGTDVAAVSFGIQYDTASIDDRYVSKPVFMTENVESNSSGGQTYEWSKYIGTLGNSYRLMLTIDGKGNYKAYINGAMVLSGTNKSLAGQSLIYPWVEGAARIDGDYVDAKFSNMKVMMYGDYNASYKFRETAAVTNPGLTITTPSTGVVEIKGTIQGLGDGYDWDNKYNDVSGRYTYYRRNDPNYNPSVG